MFAKSASPWEMKRSKSAVAITGAGTPFVDRGGHRPAAFARVADATRELREVGRLLERGRGEVEQPRRDDAAAPPHLRDLGDVEVVAGTRRDRASGAVSASAVCVRAPTLAWCRIFSPSAYDGHQRVLDAVVHHLHEVAGAGGTAVEVSHLLGRGITGTPGRALAGRVEAGRERAEDRIEALDRRVGPADHEAVAAFEAEHAAARAAVDVVDVRAGQAPANARCRRRRSCCRRR